MALTHFHRLILPADSNHHGTLYAGSLLRLALSRLRHRLADVGTQANLVLRRVLNLECLCPVPVGRVIEIEGAVLHRRQAYLVTGLIGPAAGTRSGAVAGSASASRKWTIPAPGRTPCPTRPAKERCRKRKPGSVWETGWISC